MSYAKSIYHRVVPAKIRNPIGLFRRDIIDRIQRALARIPLPPRELLANIQMTPWAQEYLGVGRRAAQSIAKQLEFSGIGRHDPARVLDFGCGSGRILRFFKGSAWELNGCDVDEEAIGWTQKALPFAWLSVCSAAPPLPYGDGLFDVVLSISVFTHFSSEDQRQWRDELARVLRPGGLLVLSTMGASVLENFPAFVSAANQARLSTEGMLFFEKDGTFNASAAFHTPKGIVETFSPPFFLTRWLERGLDGFQDLSILENRP